jgi:hypothetical protein
MTGAFWTIAGPIIMTVLTVIVGSGMAAMWREIVGLRKRLEGFEDTMAEAYVRRRELERIEDKIIKAIDKLDGNLEHHIDNSVARWQATLIKRGD